MKRYYVRYSTYRYDGEVNEAFDDLAQVEALLTQYAANPDFKFEVIYGEKMKFEPVDVVKSYRAVG